MSEVAELQTLLLKEDPQEEDREFDCDTCYDTTTGPLIKCKRCTYKMCTKCDADWKRPCPLCKLLPTIKTSHNYYTCNGYTSNGYTYYISSSVSSKKRKFKYSSTLDTLYYQQNHAKYYEYELKEMKLNVDTIVSTIKILMDQGNYNYVDKQFSINDKSDPETLNIYTVDVPTATDLELISSETIYFEKYDISIKKSFFDKYEIPYVLKYNTWSLRNPTTKKFVMITGTPGLIVVKDLIGKLLTNYQEATEVTINTEEVFHYNTLNINVDLNKFYEENDPKIIKMNDSYFVVQGSKKYDINYSKGIKIFIRYLYSKIS